MNREDMEETLSKNLEIMEKFEDYERCQEIVNGIKYTYGYIVCFGYK